MFVHLQVQIALPHNAADALQVVHRTYGYVQIDEHVQTLLHIYSDT